MADYFAHAVYGVVLTGEIRTVFYALYHRAREKLIEAFALAEKFEGRDHGLQAEDAWREKLRDLDQDEFETVVEAVPADDQKLVRDAVGAPPDAGFYHTGDEDDLRPGECQTETGLVVVGYGPYRAMELIAGLFDPQHRHKVTYESWVTGM